MMNSPQNPFNADYLPLKMNNIERKNLMQEVWNLIKNKPANYQLKDEELAKCGLKPEKFDAVREAVSKAGNAKSNIIFDFFGWIFGQVGSFIDTIIKVILVFLVFLLALQFPYLNDQANITLKGLVSEAEVNYQKYEITVKQIAEILARYQVKQAKIEKDIPEQVKKDKEAAERWLKYNNKTVQDIWSSINPFTKPNLEWPQSKIDDLVTIYQKTLTNYKPGLPNGRNAYIQAGIVSGLVLLGYIVFQALFAASAKNIMRKSALKRELKKVI